MGRNAKAKQIAVVKDEDKKKKRSEIDERIFENEDSGSDDDNFKKPVKKEKP